MAVFLLKRSVMFLNILAEFDSADARDFCKLSIFLCSSEISLFFLDSDFLTLSISSLSTVCR
jgi:hypothetical protein